MDEQEITAAVHQILEQAIKEGELFHLEPDQDKKQQGFYNFQYNLPEGLDKTPGGYASFYNCLRSSVEENRICGPSRRPLTITSRTKMERQVYQSTDPAETQGIFKSRTGVREDHAF